LRSAWGHSRAGCSVADKSKVVDPGYGLHYCGRGSLGGPCLAVLGDIGVTGFPNPNLPIRRRGSFPGLAEAARPAAPRYIGISPGTGREVTRQSGAGGVACHDARRDGPCGEQPASTASSLAPKPQKPEPKRSELTAGRRQEKSASSQTPECYIYTMSTPSANKTFGIG